MCRIRGRDISMVFQEPMTALDPLKTIGDQVAETVLIHGRTSRAEAAKIAREVLERVGLPAERFPLDRYPHELSGGQRQRVVIATAIALRPRVLVADEPTTALDVTTQAQILELLQRLVAEDGMGMIFITHDLAVVAGLADRVAIMRQGEIVETGETGAVFRALTHPYTRALFAASSHVPARTAPPTPEPGAPPVLAVENVVRDYRLPRKNPFRPAMAFRAVDGVSLTIERGENVGLVGESGSGKSTLARAIMALDSLQGGTVILDGETLNAAAGASPKARRKMQVVFQDPYDSFDPRHRVERLVAEPFHLLGRDAPTGAARRHRIAEALETVGLTATDADKYPHEFSGGQRQRIAIARALIIQPALIILDEAVSALDVSIRAQILDLLAELSGRLKLSYLFISHDLNVVRAITDRVLVMKTGKIVESGPTETVFRHPQHPYTQSLLAAAPSLEAALAQRRLRA
jgi:peptide/nickel transport system ATP-binding protein